MTLVKPIFSKNRMDYETPREGITLGGYVARRLHKTVLLTQVGDWLPHEPARALGQIALYAAAASTSFGIARYRPEDDPDGAVIPTTDPETGASVTVTGEGSLRYSYVVEMKGVGRMAGSETITGTTVGLRGLGMPAPTTFTFTSEKGNYRADILGLVTSELVPGLGRWKIRAEGALDLSDSAGNRGRLSLDRSGFVVVCITTPAGRTVDLKERLV